MNQKSAESANNESSPDIQEPKPPQPKKIVDINQPQTCRNAGCGKSFKEKDNHDTACSYHPGPPVFHDRMRGVSCILLLASTLIMNPSFTQTSLVPLAI